MIDFPTNIFIYDIKKKKKFKFRVRWIEEEIKEISDKLHFITKLQQR